MPSRSQVFPQLLLAILAVAAACLAVSSQSLWIDEAETALKAMQPTLHGWWHALDYEHNSNMQLPLYMIYIWGWARIFGFSEIALRAANIPFFFLGYFAIAHFLRRHPPLRLATLLVYCLHPFVWYYLNEARPYILQLSGALLVAGALFDALDTCDQSLTSSWWWLFAAGFTILCGSGLLGIPWAAAILIALSFRAGFWSSMRRAGLPALVVFVPLLFIIGIYFAWTILQKIAAGTRFMTVASMASVFYDQLGFIGLGPARADLRPSSTLESGAVSFAPVVSFIPGLALLAIPLAWGLFLAARKGFGLSGTRLVTALTLAVIPTLLVFALGYLRHVRMLGRHLTPLFPFILLAEAYVILFLWQSRRPLNRAAATLVIVALALSSIQLRFAPRHAKEDYRSAAALANQALAQGKSVWWAASPDGATYYNLPWAVPIEPGHVRWINGVPPDTSTPPDLIFISKPDLTDPHITLPAFIASHRYHLQAAYPAFSVWAL